MESDRIIYWHLPGFCYFRFLNQVTINLMRAFPEKFREGYRIGSVYGTFPGAIWNGGRAVFGITSKGDIEKIIKAYNEKGVPLRFTWTNSLLTQEHVSDTYCNLIMRLANNGLNQVLVNREVLEAYIRTNYPSYKLISSTTKRIVNPDTLLEEMEKDYFLVVLDYDLNHDDQVLELLHPHADRVEILVDEICYPGCPRRSDHYADESLKQLEYEISAPYPCPNRNTPRSFDECRKRPAFIAADEIDSYIEKGFRNFKLVGRGLPQNFVKESYLYYLVKEEERAFIRAKMDKTLQDLADAQRNAQGRRR